MPTITKYKILETVSLRQKDLKEFVKQGTNRAVFKIIMPPFALLEQSNFASCGEGENAPDESINKFVSRIFFILENTSIPDEVTYDCIRQLHPYWFKHLQRNTPKDFKDIFYDTISFEQLTGVFPTRILSRYSTKRLEYFKQRFSNHLDENVYYEVAYTPIDENRLAIERDGVQDIGLLQVTGETFEKVINDAIEKSQKNESRRGDGILFKAYNQPLTGNDLSIILNPNDNEYVTNNYFPRIVMLKYLGCSSQFAKRLETNAKIKTVRKDRIYADRQDYLRYINECFHPSKDKIGKRFTEFPMIFTLRELVDLLGISYSNLFILLNNGRLAGKIGYFKIGDSQTKHIRFEIEEVKEYIQQNYKKI